MSEIVQNLNAVASRWDEQMRINRHISDVAWKSTGQDESNEKIDADRWSDTWVSARRTVLGEELRACSTFEQLRELSAEIAEGAYDNLYGVFS